MSFVRFFTITLALGAIQHIFAQDGYEKELMYAVSHDHYLQFPILKKELDNWKTQGTTVFLKDKVVLVPQVKDKRGALVSS